MYCTCIIFAYSVQRNSQVEREGGLLFLNYQESIGDRTRLVSEACCRRRITSMAGRLPFPPHDALAGIVGKMLSWKKTDGEKSRFLVLFVVLLTQSLYAVSPTLYSNVLVPSFFIKEKKKGKEKGGAGEGENVIVL